jgi:beta-lactamase superfamily II metal-dependent hydrolase
MTKKKQKMHFVFSYLRLCICIALLMAVVAAYYIIPKIITPQTQDNGGAPLRFHAINVGDGDCLVVELPDKKILMVDTGKPNKYSAVKEYLDNKIFNARTDNKIDYFINTHPDDDHYGGMEKLLADYEIGIIYRPCFDSASVKDDADNLPTIGESANTNYGRLVDLMYEETPNVYVGAAGLSTSAFGGDNYTVTIHSPTVTQVSNLKGSGGGGSSSTVENALSPILTIEYARVIFVLTGDATTETETLFNASSTAAEMFSGTSILSKSVILKVGHHGSKTSTGQAFVNTLFGNVATENSYAVISCGTGYGFPTEPVMERLRPECSQILVTKDIGDIAIYTDGAKIQINGAEPTQVEPTQINAADVSIYGTAAILVIILCFYNYNKDNPTKKTKEKK